MRVAGMLFAWTICLSVTPLAFGATVFKLKSGEVVRGEIVKEATDGKGVTFVWIKRESDGIDPIMVCDAADIVSRSNDTSEPASPSTKAPAPAPPPAPPEGLRPERPPGARPTARAPVDEPTLRALRNDWSRLGPYASMQSELYLVKVTPKVVADKFRAISELLTVPFESEGELRDVAQTHLKFLADSETAVIPTFRAQFSPMDVLQSPGDVAVSILVEAMSRGLEQNVLQMWQTDLDRRCRGVFERLMPTITRLAAPPQTGVRPEFVRPTSDGDGLLLSNGLDFPITDATIELITRAVDGSTAKQYYFMERWDPENQFAPRASAELRGSGFFATTGGTVRVLSNEWSSEALAFSIPLNSSEAVRRLIAPLSRTVSKKALATLRRARSLIENDRELRLQMNSLIDDAEKNIAARLDKLRDQRDQLRRKFTQLTDERSKCKDAVQRERLDQHQKYLDGRIRAISAEIADLE